MEAQEDKNKQKDPKEQISVLEQEMKSAFKEGNYEAVKAATDKIKAIAPENHLAEKLMAKVEKVKTKEDAKAQTQKVREYRVMLKKLYKDRDSEKLTALAKEFKAFDPENKHAAKWILRAEKLQEKMSGKKEEKQELKIGAGKEKEGIMQMMAKKAPTTATPVATVAEPTKTVETPKTKAPDSPKEEKGNLFTRMFKKKEEETQKKSIIDTIVAKTDKKEEKKPVEKKDETDKSSEKKKEMGLLVFSKVFMNFVAIFIVLSAAFLYVEWIDKDNTVLGLAGISENTGGRLHSASEELSALKKEETTLSKDIDLYKGGYDDKALDAVEKIIDGRINWPDIFAKINEVTNSVYELNDFFKYIEYNNYSFDAKNGTIRVSGTLSDPLGRNLTKLVVLEEAFKYYPKDRNNPDDMTEPYFIGFKEFTAFSKTLDSDTGRYNSSFQLSFSLNE